jgi:hypothetical protein
MVVTAMTSYELFCQAIENAQMELDMQYDHDDKLWGWANEIAELMVIDSTTAGFKRMRELKQEFPNISKDEWSRVVKDAIMLRKMAVKAMEEACMVSYGNAYDGDDTAHEELQDRWWAGDEYPADYAGLA